MYETFIISLHPTRKMFYKCIYNDRIIETAHINNAKSFNTYKEAQKELKKIIQSKTNSEYYISIEQYFIKIN